MSSVSDRDDHLTGVDADAQPDVGAEVALQLGGEWRERLLHRSTGPHRPERVVLAEDGDAEDRHQPVAHELHNSAVVRGDGIGEQPVHLVHHAAGRLGVEPLLERGRARKVGEQDRDDLADRGQPPRAGASRRPAAPHASQNRAPSARGAPHAPQPAGSLEPQPAQKVAPSRLALPHPPHVML